MTINLQDVLETIRVTCGEQGCDPSEITAEVLNLAAGQVDDAGVAKFLRDSAADMDRPVGLGDIAASLRREGVR